MIKNMQKTKTNIVKLSSKVILLVFVVALNLVYIALNH